MSQAKIIQKQLSSKGKVLHYTVRRNRRARRLRLSVYPDGQLVATVPYGTRDTLVREFVRDKFPWIVDTLRYYAKFRGNSLLRQDAETYQKYKEEARALVASRLAFWNQYYGLQYERVSIKNHRTQWGSCSEKRNLNFNYKIVFLPKRLADYVIVHELAHVREMNHSDRFWKVVAEAIPDFERRERDLRGYRIA
jgi:predicted metal-dependent hydrolase